jgi:hypothetical protein
MAPVFLGAEHCAVLPPALPAQLHDHGPVPATADAEPLLHRPLVGAELTATPLAGPHAPLTGPVFLGAEHCAVLPPALPAQLHDHGPLPATADAEPLLHSPLVGAELTATPLAGPHAPLTGLVFLGAEHCAVLPPALPAQLHDHGPVPATADAEPMLHRPLVGAELTATPLAGPHAPLTALSCVTLIENAASAAVALTLLTLITIFE